MSMAGMEGGYRPQNKEAAFKAGSPGGGPQQSFGEQRNTDTRSGEEKSQRTLHEQLVTRFRVELAKEGVVYSVDEEGATDKRRPLTNVIKWFRHKAVSSREAAVDESVPYEVWKLSDDLYTAWVAVTYQHMDEKMQGTVSRGMIEYVVAEERDKVLLNSRGMQLLDAMAEVAEIPDYLPGREEIPLPLETAFSEKYAARLRECYVKKG